MKSKLVLLSTLVFGLVPVGTVSAQTPVWPMCLSADSDSDGDGYGWENDTTCLVPVTQMGACEDRGDYPWGWNPTTLSSCRLDQQVVTNPPNEPVINACIDSDGDGYGWNGSSTCLVSESDNDDSNTNIISTGNTCVDTDGDGYGWDGIASCVVPGLINSMGDRVCIDTDGDGFDFRDTGACLRAVDVVGVDSTITRITEGADGNGLGVQFSPWFDASNGENLSVQVSDDAQYVAFSVPARNAPFQSTNRVPINLYFRNTVTNEIQIVGTDSYLYDMTPDGRYIVFGSSATNTASTPNTTEIDQLYRYDTVTQETLLVSQNIFGEAGNSNSGGRESARFGITNLESVQISDDGNLIAYKSDATNLIANDLSQSAVPEPPSNLHQIFQPVFVFNVDQMRTVSPAMNLFTDGDPINFHLTPDSTTLLLSIGEGFSEPAVALQHDLTTGENTELNVEANSTGVFRYSANGKYILFIGGRLNLDTGNVDQEELTVIGNSIRLISAISPGGRYAAIATGVSQPSRTFTSLIYLHDYSTNTTTFVSGGRLPQFTSDGKYLFFQSSGGKPVGNGASNAAWDGYLYELNP